jgi:hypothetical protein
MKKLLLISLLFIGCASPKEEWFVIHWQGQGQSPITYNAEQVNGSDYVGGNLLLKVDGKSLKIKARIIDISTNRRIIEIE